MNEAVHEAKRQHANKLRQRSNVVGVGVGYKVTDGLLTDIESVVVFVSEKVPVAFLGYDDLIPDKLDEVETDVVQLGEVRAQTLQGGDSVGHYKIGAGTAGIMVVDNETGERVLLSNNHVLANSNAAFAGDYILSPGSIDGGTIKSNTIGYLARFERILFEGDFVPEPQPDPLPDPVVDMCRYADAAAGVANGVAWALGSRFRMIAYNAREPISVLSFGAHTTHTNKVDAAIARLESDVAALPGIQGIGGLRGQQEIIEPGLPIQKYGRTTKHTHGMILYVDAVVSVSYGPDKVAVFDDQLIATDMSAPGDSGSFVVSNDRMAVGLLFAGSDTSTIINPIQPVLDALDLSLEVER